MKDPNQLDIHSLDYDLDAHLIPAKVKIVSCAEERLWYKDKIGMTFEVYRNNFYDAFPLTGFWLQEDINRNYRPVWRFISKEDCEEIK
jgi:hypothetical protein